MSNPEVFKNVGFRIINENGDVQLDRESFDWLIQQAERMEELDETLNDTWYMRTSKKLGELNEFLQKRQSKGVGENVIDVAMSHIRKQEMTIAGNETTRRQLVERVKEVEKAALTTHNMQAERIKKLEKENQRYKQALEQKND